MIRRGFWLVLGAILGVGGYRRVTQLAHALVPGARGPQSGARELTRRPELTGRRVLAGAARAGRSAAEGAAFVRDVREGMAEYLDREGQETGAAQGSQRGRPEPGSQRRRAAARRSPQ